jgi:hypothetical protein
VSYATVDLGQIRVRVLEQKTEGGMTVYTAQANIDSYKGVPFVDLHAIFDNAIADPVHARRFTSRMKGEQGWDTVYYDFDYAGKRCVVRNRPSAGGGDPSDETLTLNAPSQDGLSLFYYARQEAGRKQRTSMPTIVSGKQGTTTFDFLIEHTEEEIDALDYPVDVVYFKGEAGFVGIFGLSGEFEGWFSNDEARVPIVGKMKVLIGSVRIELMKWKRDGWNPPRYRE